MSAKKDVKKRITTYKPPPMIPPQNVLGDEWNIDTEAGPAMTVAAAVAERERVRAAYKDRLKRVDDLHRPLRVWAFQLPDLIDKCDELFVQYRTMLTECREVCKTAKVHGYQLDVPYEKGKALIREFEQSMTFALKEYDAKLTEMRAAHPEWYGSPALEEPEAQLTDGELADLGGIRL